MTPATLTLEAINDHMAIDQGAKFRGLLRRYMPLAEDAYSEEEDPFRSHLGASIIGRECARELWYSFHWATQKRFDGRMLRLFNRGHLEEPRMVALLAMIGCTVYQYDAAGNQYRVTGHMGHFGGSLDAVVANCPDYMTQPILGEFKTHGDKSFQKLKVDGVIKSKWEHFIQMQIYMGKNQLPAALYMATNKNDDDLHAEIVEFDHVVYQRYLDRSQMIIDSHHNNPPKIMNASAGWYKCKFCDHTEVCHNPKAMPVSNCRTCQFAHPIDEGKWTCNRDYEAVELSKSKQLVGCENYALNTSAKS